MFCNHSVDIEDIGSKAQKRFQIPEDKKSIYLDFVKEFIQVKDEKSIKRTFRDLSRKYHIFPSKNQITRIINQYSLEKPDYLIEYLIKKKSRSTSGGVVVAVCSPPLSSCSYNCSYCPTPKGNNGKLYVPKSYDPKEPTIARGLRNNFNPEQQFFERGDVYMMNGHNMDKVELIVRGGTWHCYPENTQIDFITRLYYAANVFYDRNKPLRKMLKLDDEVLINKEAKCRIIGLTLETRPDFGIKNFTNNIVYQNEEMNGIAHRRLRHIIYNLRRFGCTRIEFGIQHTDDTILQNINRGSCISDAIYTIKLMKDCCFKIVGHWMFDLPDSNYYDDLAMMNYVIYSQDLQLDDWKLYPTAVTSNTEIYKWYKDGTYTPYSETNFDSLIDLCIKVKTKVPKWIRIDRLTRDIPSTSIVAGYNKMSNFRQLVQENMKKQNKDCKCLRCKEVKSNTSNIKYAKKCVTKYKASHGDEYFISYESCSCKLCWKYYLFLIVQTLVSLIGIKLFWSGCKNYNILYGFCRLRLCNNPGANIFTELKNSALVRELKVYGRVVPHFKTAEKKIHAVQHRGFGKKLMKEAESIARYNKYPYINVINGIGTEEYYVKKLGYKSTGYFVGKVL